MTEINGRFNTWALDENFESTDPRYPLAVIVTQYAAPQFPGPLKPAPSNGWSRLSASILCEDTKVTEFASQIRALGHQINIDENIP